MIKFLLVKNHLKNILTRTVTVEKYSVLSDLEQYQTNRQTYINENIITHLDAGNTGNSQARYASENEEENFHHRFEATVHL